MKRSLHVFRRSNGTWSVRATGAERASKTFETQREAVTYARTAVKSVSGSFTFTEEMVAFVNMQHTDVIQLVLKANRERIREKCLHQLPL